MMKQRYFYIVPIIFYCLFSSCSFGVPYVDLGNNYALLEDKIILKIKEIGENHISGELIIRTQILNYDYDDRFIIVYQIYDGSSDIYTLNPMQEGRDSLLIQFEKLRDIRFCYWIIDKETDEVMGPMREEEFDRRCKALNVKAKMNKFFEKKSWDSVNPEYNK